ncbi:MAG: exodeoxyribonuclease VII large subunit [Bacteroidetes bacterium]|nr:MAG: exodeoxyribonuclease VII large subunit [Bacteroidota bacterium]
MVPEKQIFTLKQVAQSIQKTIAERYARNYWIQAEVHKLNQSSKGHCYPELVYKEEGQIVAEMRGIIWASAFQRINKRFMELVREPIRDGLSLLLQARINYHPIYGMSLEIVDIDPSFSLGELQKERDESLKRLKRENLLNRNQLLDFPLLPQRLAIISVGSSKGLSDFFSVIEENPWGYHFFTMLFEAKMDGEGAAVSIRHQLERIARVKEHFDVVCIIRGGGGEIGLSCYNNYELSRDIACFPLPVLTGIGHSTNLTVAEMIAFQNTITPTRLAEFLLQCFHEFSQPLERAVELIRRESQAILENSRKELRNELRLTVSVSKTFLSEQFSEWKRISMNFNQQVKLFGREERFALKEVVGKLEQGAELWRRLKLRDLSEIQDSIRRRSREQLAVRKTHLLEKQGGLRRGAELHFQRSDELLKSYGQSLRLLDPMEVLKRGYSLTLKQGKLITAQNPVAPGDEVEIKQFDQSIWSEVKRIEKDE